MTRIIAIAVLIFTLLFAGSTPVSPFTMGDANPNHEMLGPWQPWRVRPQLPTKSPSKSQTSRTERTNRNQTVT